MMKRGEERRPEGSTGDEDEDEDEGRCCWDGVWAAMTIRATEAEVSVPHPFWDTTPQWTLDWTDPFTNSPLTTAPQHACCCSCLPATPLSFLYKAQQHSRNLVPISL
ncbi:hypothetical protein ACOMHN_046366 [Nucella lapillus]